MDATGACRGARQAGAHRGEVGVAVAVEADDLAVEHRAAPGEL